MTSVAPLRIGFDMDGVLANFAAAFRVVEARLFPEPSGTEAGPKPPDPHEKRRKQAAVWSEIESTTDFWTTLQPTQEGAVGHVHELMLRHQWEVFFITQRPATAGETVQRQTQRWLVAQGFDLPSVLVIAGSRGAAATALRLNYHVDDSPQHCVDVLGAGAKPVLISDGSGPTVATVRKLGIAIMPNIGECLDLLEQASAAASNPTLLKRLATLVGWR